MAWLNLEDVYGLEKFDNYEINQEGILRNVKTKRILEGAVTKYGYVRFHLRQDGLTKNVYKHRILAELWIFNPDNLTCVDHIDRNKLNNSIENLRWCSVSENSRNVSMPKTNASGEMNIFPSFNHGRPRWRVEFGSHSTGNEHQKLFKRDPNSDIIPDEVIAYRDAYSKMWKKEFNPL
jgi:hypothetical protein